jgi:hypothetical protein
MNHSPTPLCTWPAVDTHAWPAPRVPFPVVAPYRPRPDLARLGAPVFGRREARLLDDDASLPADLRKKWSRLQEVPLRCVALAAGLADDPGAVWRRVNAAAHAIARTDVPCDETDSPLLIAAEGDALHCIASGWTMPADPGRPFRLRALRPDAIPVVDWIASRPVAEQPLHALALSLQEDLAWIEAPAAAAPVVAAMLHVCWPSGWDPARKVGLDFAAIHAPVADGDALRAAASPLSRVLVAQGPFVRFVWTIAPDGFRSRHPDELAERGGVADGPGSAEELWLRVERQVTVPIGAGFGGGAALFLIRVHLVPLAEAVADPERRALLCASLESMSAATLAYKRLDRIRDLLRREWG